MKSHTRKICLASVVAALIAAPAFAGAKPTIRHVGQFWNFTTAETSDANASLNVSNGRSIAKAVHTTGDDAANAKIMRFTPQAGDLGDFVLTLASSHRPAGFNSNSFALALMPLRDFESSGNIGSTYSFTSSISPDGALPSSGLIASSANEFTFSGPLVSPVPEPSTVFGAALAVAGVAWTQRRRLLALFA